MRRKDRERSHEFAKEVLDHCSYAVLAMVNTDGTPYCIPISTVREDDYLYFHCALRGQKIENLRANPAVCLTAVGRIRIPEDEFSVQYESAVVHGTAQEVIEDAEKLHALRLLCKHYVPTNMAHFDAEIAKDFPYTGVWKIHIEHITGKSKPITDES